MNSAQHASFRLIVQPKMEGRLDMAVDEAIAEAVGSARCVHAIRLYGFSPPTLSLGRFQRTKGMLRTDRLAGDGVTLVRRPTGGHAVLHDDELTYSVILSKALIANRLGDCRKQTVYQFIAQVLLVGLGRLGIQGRINQSRQGALRNPDCFRSSGEFEITSTDGRKLIGSAQMTTRTAILQHGSIPMTNPGQRVSSYLTTEEPLDSQEPTSLNEQVRGRLGFEEVQSAFVAAFRETLKAEDSELSTLEQDSAARLFADKYSSDTWNFAY